MEEEGKMRIEEGEKLNLHRKRNIHIIEDLVRKTGFLTSIVYTNFLKL